MKYLKSEYLKFRRTFSNKLLVIAPIITAILRGLWEDLPGINICLYSGGTPLYFPERLRFSVICPIKKNYGQINTIPYIPCQSI